VEKDLLVVMETNGSKRVVARAVEQMVGKLEGVGTGAARIEGVEGQGLDQI